MKRLLLYFLFISYVFAEERPVKSNFDVDHFFKTNLIIDGEVNYYMPRGQRPKMWIGQPNFERDANGESVKEATGIDVGISHFRTEGILEIEAKRFESGEYTGAGVIRSGGDLDRLYKEGKYGVIFYSQLHFPLEGDPRRVEVWYDKGLRVLQLAYDPSEGVPESELLAGGGGGGSNDPSGLTILGKKVVLECIRLGMIIDVSHGNERSTLDLAEYCRKKGVPITANHAPAYALRIREPRNRFVRGKTDDEMRAIAGTGGVVGIMTGDWIKRKKEGTQSIEDFIAHIDYAVKLIGADHVGIATDGYIGGDGSGPGNADGIIDTPRRFKETAKRLHSMGYSEGDLRKIFGGNFRRVIQVVLDRKYVKN